jgi:hypothetical protein
MGTVTDLLTKLITEAPLSAVLRERIELAKEQAQALEREVARLREENRTQKLRLEELDGTVASSVTAGQFVEHRGALFKRRASGGYHDAVFCPSCQCPMSSLEGRLPYNCSRCHILVDFIGADLKRVMKELEEYA